MLYEDQVLFLLSFFPFLMPTLALLLVCYSKGNNISQVSSPSEFLWEDNRKIRLNCSLDNNPMLKNNLIWIGSLLPRTLSDCMNRENIIKSLISVFPVLIGGRLFCKMNFYLLLLYFYVNDISKLFQVGVEFSPQFSSYQPTNQNTKICI